MRVYRQIVLCRDDHIHAESFHERKDFHTAGYRIYFRDVHFMINKN